MNREVALWALAVVLVYGAALAWAFQDREVEPQLVTEPVVLEVSP